MGLHVYVILCLSIFTHNHLFYNTPTFLRLGLIVRVCFIVYGSLLYNICITPGYQIANIIKSKSIIFM